MEIYRIMAQKITSGNLVESKVKAEKKNLNFDYRIIMQRTFNLSLGADFSLYFHYNY